MFITYLTPALQQRMHETEGAYNLVKLEEVQLLEGLSLQQHRCTGGMLTLHSTA
jgi:hypothetical protein